MNHASLFTGFGGFDIASEWIGWNNVLTCDIDPFCNILLKYYWPNATHYEDIKTTDFKPWRGRIDVLSAGFPCQPFSVAGSRQGMEDKQNRYLWPETRRAYQESRPRWLVLENVPGLLTILEPDKISEMEAKAVELFGQGDETERVNTIVQSVHRRIIGIIVEEIRADGYVLPETEDGAPIIMCVPACAVNAPHRRDRIFICAYDGEQLPADSRRKYGTGITHNGQSERAISDQEEAIVPERSDSHDPEGASPNPTGSSAGSSRQGDGDHRKGRDAAHESQERRSAAKLNIGLGDVLLDATNATMSGREGGKSGQGEVLPRGDGESVGLGYWSDFPTQPIICSGNDGFPDYLDFDAFFEETGYERPETPAMSYPKWRTETLKGFGNAVVPQVAFEIFKAINEYESNGQRSI